MRIAFLHRKAVTPRDEHELADIAKVLEAFDASIDEKEVAAGHVDPHKLGDVTAYVVDCKGITRELSYVLAFLILQKKPILCLFSTKGEYEEVRELLPVETLPDRVYMEVYFPHTLGKLVAKYITDVRSFTRSHESPTIKFTLRLTRRMEHYLDWVQQSKKQRKATFVREQLQKLADEDTDWQAYLKRRQKDLPWL